MIYEITQLHPRVSKPFRARLAYGNDMAIAMDEDGKYCLERLERPNVERIAADGISITGFQSHGHERDGRVKYRYQEWWCRYAEEAKA